MHIAIVNLIIINFFITIEKFEIKYINSNKENIRKIVKLRYECFKIIWNKIIYFNYIFI